MIATHYGLSSRITAIRPADCLIGMFSTDFNDSRYDQPMQIAAHPYCVVLCTCPTTALADQIAQTLVAEQHAACVNILPGIQSVYRWQGKIARDNEVLLLIKTDEGHLAQVERCIRALHSYEVPEMIVLPISHGHAPYLNWITESVTP